MPWGWTVMVNPSAPLGPLGSKVSDSIDIVLAEGIKHLVDK